MDYTQLTLTANRIRLIPARIEYAGDICSHFTADITRYMWPSAPKTRDEINRHILLKQSEMKAGEEIFLLIVDRNSGEFFGCANIHGVKSGTPELGIWLKKGAQGRSYAYEAMRLLLSWAEQNIDYDYLKYPVDKNNIPSRKLAEKLGGLVEDEYLKTSESGNVLDELEYRMHKTKHLNRPSC